jgi:type II secretion system protein H
MYRNRKLRIVQNGFTMIELMVVLAIIAIAAAIVVPIASSAGSMQLRAAVTMVAADLEYAKSMSISRGQRYSVVFDASGEKYWIVSGDVYTVDNAIAHPLKPQARYVVDFPHDSRLSGVDIASVNFDGASTVSFDYLGIPYSVDVAASPAALVDHGLITLQAGGATRTVRVEAVTGYISVSN